MASRSGGTPIRTNKVKPGYDQAFTLPKGTSAAPIKNVPVKPKAKVKKLKKAYNFIKKKDLDLGAAIVGFGLSGGTVASVLGKKMKEVNAKKEKQKKLSSVGKAKRGYGKAIR